MSKHEQRQVGAATSGSTQDAGSIGLNPKAEVFDPQKHDARIGETFRALNRIHGEVASHEDNKSWVTVPALRQGAESASRLVSGESREVATGLLKYAAEFGLRKDYVVEALLAAGALATHLNVDSGPGTELRSLIASIQVTVEHDDEYHTATKNAVAEYTDALLSAN